MVSKQLDLYADHLMAALEARGVPFRNEQQMQDITTEPAARLVVDYLSCLLGKREPKAWVRLMNQLVPFADDEVQSNARKDLDRLIKKQRKEAVIVELIAEPFAGWWESVRAFLKQVGVETLAGSVGTLAKAAGVTEEDSDMWLGGLEFTPIDDLKFRTSLYAVPDLLASSYSDAVWTTPTGADSKLRLSGQFMYQGGIGDDLLMECSCDTWAAGAKGEMILGKLTLTAGYTQISDEFNYQSPYGSWAGYTSMIVKDFNRAGEKALLLGLSYDFADLGAEGLVFTSLAAFDLDVDNDVPKWNEYDFTLDYRLSTLEDTDWAWLSPLWLRARYAYVDIGDDDDLNDFRIIANYEIQFQGSDLHDRHLRRPGARALSSRWWRGEGLRSGKSSGVS